MPNTRITQMTNNNKQFARIYLADLQIQTFFKSRYSLFLYQCLSYFCNVKDQKSDGNYITKIVYPAQKTILEMFPNITDYQIRTAIKELKKIILPNDQPLLVVQRRMGNSALYIITVPLHNVEHDQRNDSSNMINLRFVEHDRRYEKTNMIDVRSVEHDQRKTEKQTKKITKKITNNNYSKIDYSFLDDD